MDRATETIAQLQKRWRSRCLLPFFLAYLPVFALVIIGVWQFGWPQWLLAACFAIPLLTLGLDKSWRLSALALCQKLDGQFPQLQDSSYLLYTAPQNLNALAQLQRARITEVLGQLQTTKQLNSLFPRWHHRLLLPPVSAGMGLLLFAFTHWWGCADSIVKRSVASQQPTAIAITEATTLITPPRYTHLPALKQALQITAQEGATIEWKIALNVPVDGLQMLSAEKNYLFTALDPLPSRNWQLTRLANREDFYQLAAYKSDKKIILPDIHNVRIKLDAAPEIIFNSAQNQITIVPEIRANGALPEVEVTVSDDFAVVDTELLITLTSGDGENLRFRDERVQLEPLNVNSGKNHYRFSIPLERYTPEPGDELYWQLQATDNRQPEPNLAKSQRFILRWPQQEIFGISDSEGMAVKILPEYFRSQRQLIMDTKALLEQHQQLEEPVFRQRSETLAYEQNLLRMRYGRFLGEEDSALEHSGPPPEDEHDHEPVTTARETQFGNAEGVIASVGHQHDHTEHATLFDPKTKGLLREALNAMWDAWRDLAVIEPAASLPHQQRALRLIKEVQQASRIYLQRVGFEPPPIDESRRLSGERSTIKPSPFRHSEPRPGSAQQIRTMLTSLRNGHRLDKAAMEQIQQLAQNREKPQQGIELSKRLRLYQQQPECGDCRQQLTQFLYTLLPSPAASPSLPREHSDRGSFSRWLQSQKAGAGR